MESVNESILTSEATLEEWLHRWLMFDFAIGKKSSDAVIYFVPCKSQRLPLGLSLHETYPYISRLVPVALSPAGGRFQFNREKEWHPQGEGCSF
jgi:hypothetical protein